MNFKVDEGKDNKSNVKRVLKFLLVLLTAKSSWAQQQKYNTFENLSNNKDKISISTIFFSGIVLRNVGKSQVWHIPNAFELFPANTVEGFVISPQVQFTQNFEEGRFFSLYSSLRYGFGNKRFQAQLKSDYLYNPKANRLVSIAGGRAIEQLYHESTLNALNNTLNTFALSENFLKIYERFYIELMHTFSPIKDFLLTTSLSWNERTPLVNLGKYENDEDFTSNAPENIELNNTLFERHQAVIFDAELRWQIGYHFTKRRGQLISEGKYPALILSYSNANEAILNGDLSYQKLAFGIQGEFKIGEGYGRGLFEIGDFLSKSNLSFVDFNHFKGNEIAYGTYGNDQFQLLEYYANSTAEFYIQGHYEHLFKSIRKRCKSKLQPIAGLHYLYTGASGHYIELGIGVNNILKAWRIDFYNNWRGRQYESFGIRIGLKTEYN